MSAGLFMYRRQADRLQVFLVHPGGPFWSAKNVGAWSIPKGGLEAGEKPLDAARREFHEETGLTSVGPFRPLQEARQKSGKRVLSWAFEGDGDAESIQSNTFSLEWPPKSGKLVEFPEVDRAAWFTVQEARFHMQPGQLPLLEELEEILRSSRDGTDASERDPRDETN